MSGNPRLKFNVIIWLSLALLLFIMGMLLIGGFGNDRPLTTPLAQTTSYPPVPPLTPTVTPSVTPTTTASPTSYPTLGSAPTTTPTATPTALILVSQGDSLPDRSSPSPTATPLGHIACTITAKALHLREGPGSTYGSIGTLSTGAEVSAFKCAPSANWILVQTARQETGWINPAYAVCRGDLTQLPLAGGVVAQAPSPATNPPAPIPTSTPSEDSLPPPAVDSWRGDYFDNPHLAGEPVLVRMDPNLEFNWILDSPAPGIPVDNFSVRWSRQFDFLDGGDFRFFAEVDDGIKIYVDGRVILDDWHTFAPVTYQADVRDLSPGLHLVIVEYFESGGHARIKVWGQDTQLEDEKWQAEYYPNSDLQSPAAFTRQDEEIDFDWGHEAPVFGLDPDNFSVRWQRSIYFDKSGDYKFLAKLADEDRVKIFLDGWLVVDKFKEKSGTVEGQFARLAPGFHTVIVEYAEEGDRSTIKVWWERL